MKIRKWHCYIVFNCAVVIPCLFGKPVSLNAIIAADNKNTQITEITPDPKTKGLVRKPVSLNELIAAENLKNQVSDSTLERHTKATPLINEISFLKDKKSNINSIKSRLNPQDILNKLRKKRKSKSNKREIIQNEDLNSNYIPVLRNLGKLFDKVLHNDAGTTFKKLQKGRLKYNKVITERNGMVCTCQQKIERSTPIYKSPKKTATYAKTSSAEISAASETAAETAADPAMAHVRSLGPNKNLPLLLSRNSLSSWRNHNGYGKRSSSPFHGDLKRNITGDNGNSKYNSRIRENESNTESNEADTDGFARNSSSSDGFRRGHGNDTRSSNYRKKTDEDIKFKKIENDIGWSSDEFDRQNKFKIGRNETGNEISIPEHGRRNEPRGDVPEDQIGANTEPVQSEENNEKGNGSVALDSSNDQRISVGSGAVTTEAEDVSSEDITVISIDDMSNLTLALQSAPKGNLPVVTIFGGYSVAKDINGQNKLSEQSIHIHSAPFNYVK